jgi:hypothetical protein
MAHSKTHTELWIEDAGMDFLNHLRFKCGQNVQRDGGHAPEIARWHGGKYLPLTILEN